MTICGTHNFDELLRKKEIKKRNHACSQCKSFQIPTAFCHITHGAGREWGKFSWRESMGRDERIK
jgi:hypothetical protein